MVRVGPRNRILRLAAAESLGFYRRDATVQVREGNGCSYGQLPDVRNPGSVAGMKVSLSGIS